MSGDGVISRQVTLKVSHGLHLTPISQLVQRATGFGSSISLQFDGRTADVKSVYDLMMLAAPCGSNMRLEARGADAEAAVESLAQLFNGGFIVPE